MKKILVLAVAVMSLLFISCKDDTPDPYYSDWGVTVLDEDATLGYKIVLDDTTLLVPQASDVIYTAADNQRILVVYQLSHGSSISDDSILISVSDLRVTSIDDIVVVDSALNVDSLGVDAMGIYSTGFMLENNLLTLDVLFSASYVRAVNHYFHLVYFPDTVVDEKDVYLELRHDANADLEQEYVRTYICFDFESIEPFATQDSLSYVIKFDDGDYNNVINTIEGVYIR